MFSRSTDDLDPEAAASFHEIAGRLRGIAARGSYGVQIADMVARRYGDALAGDPDPYTREQLWREFLVALHAFLLLHASPPSRDVSSLQSILDENSDLIPRRAAHKRQIS